MAKIVKGITSSLGLTVPESAKRAQRDAEAAAKRSAEAAQLASQNIEKNSLISLASAQNAPDVVAGGTADMLGGVGTDLKRKKTGLAASLGLTV